MNPMANTSSPYIVELSGLEHRMFDLERREQFIVRVNQEIRIRAQSITALVGPSGCGKTTLLSILGLLRSPSHPAHVSKFILRTVSEAGTVAENDVRELWVRRKMRTLETLRRKYMGFALQNGELLPSLTVRENIAAPLWLNGVRGSKCWTRVSELLTAFGLDRTKTSAPNDFSERQTASAPRLSYSRINRLSGGEYQRVALARAVAHKPMLIFVDEPTSALNREMAWGALRQLRMLQCEPSSRGAAVMITHDEHLATAFADQIIRMAPVRNMAAGEVVEIVENEPRDSEGDLQESQRAVEIQSAEFPQDSIVSHPSSALSLPADASPVQSDHGEFNL